MTPEDLLHLFGPFLPTDRFRALLRNQTLPTTAEGAALVVDVSSFLPLTTQLVARYGSQASEELKRRLNPMLEAIAGQVFNHGGSVIRFSGDGFLAWFDERRVDLADGQPSVPAVLRATAAGLEMQNLMPLFPDLRVKVAIGPGMAYRWAIGRPEYGLNDLLSGPAVEATLSIAARALPAQVLIHHSALPMLRAADVTLEQIHLPDASHLHVTAIPAALARAARSQRWPAWQVEADVQDTLHAVRPFVTASLREQLEGGFGNFVGELRYALPMFIQLSPTSEAARDPLNQQIGRVQDVLANSGGRLVSVEVGRKGNIVFAVFGAPVTYGDDAERAIAAAMTLRDQRDDRDQPLARQIGISRGLLYAGIVGGEVRHEYSTIGDETNVASRLMNAALPGQILVTSRVRSEVEERFNFHDLTPIHIKGKDEPIAVSEPLSRRSGSSRQAQSGALVGRAKELARLHRLIQAVSAQVPRIVRIEGEAGIGKSRLLLELMRLSGEAGFQVIAGNCLSTGRATPYLPWRELLAALLEIPIASDSTDSIKHLSQKLEVINPEWLLRLPLLGELLQLPIPDTPTTLRMTGHARRQALFALVTDLVLVAAWQQPLTILLEDIQWIDEVSEALLIELGRRLSVDPAPVLVALANRPMPDVPSELTEAFSGLTQHSTLLLTELAREDIRQLIETYLRASTPPELADFVYEKAQGNPLFVQEVLDTLEETGKIRLIGGLAFIEGDLAKADLPRTVQGLIQARLDRLSETDKLVLKVASVIGNSFQVRVLVASLPIPMSAAELHNHLQTLVAREFLSDDPAVSEPGYVFKHAIIQEVTYQSLLFAQRRQLHQMVGGALETISPDAIERLAYHFVRSGDVRRAWRYLLASAQKADREYANQAALGYLAQALDLTSQAAERFDLHRRRIIVLLRIGSLDLVHAELAVIDQLAAEADEELWKANVQLLRANYLLQISRWMEALNEARGAVALAEASHTDELAWESYLLLCEIYRALDDQQAARVTTVPMKGLVERLADPRKQVYLTLQELEAIYQKQPSQALDGAYAALTQAESLQDLMLEADCWSSIATFHFRDNNRPAALNAYKNQISLERQIGNRRGEGHALTSIGRALTGLGQFSEGNAHLLEAFKILHQIGERWGEAMSLTFLGVIASHRRAYEEALAYMGRGLQIIRDLRARSDIGLTLFYIGNAYLAKGDRREAEAAYLEALGLFEQLGYSAPLVELHASLAEIELNYGDPNVAARHIEPFLPSLEQGKTNDMQQPGLAYWRAIQVMDRVGQTDVIARLMTAFREHNDRILEKLDSPAWREAYLFNIWYHRALLDFDFNFASRRA